jgi:hypothetical protein
MYDKEYFAHVALQVASVLVAALAQPAAANKVVEIVGTPTAPALAADKWFDV